MDATGELTELGGGPGQLEDRLVERLERDLRLSVDEPGSRDLQDQTEVHQALLRAVVEIALEPAALGVTRRHDPRTRSPQVRLSLLAVGDVAKVPGEHWLAGQIDARDRQL